VIDDDFYGPFERLDRYLMAADRELISACPPGDDVAIFPKEGYSGSTTGPTAASRKRFAPEPARRVACVRIRKDRCGPPLRRGRRRLGQQMAHQPVAGRFGGLRN